MRKINYDCINNFINFQKTKGKAILIRSPENKGVMSGCLTGWLDNQISDYGIKQSQYLSVNLFKDLETDIDLFYKSDLKRSNQIFEIISGYSKYNTIKTSLLRDINYGELEGFYYDGLELEKKKLMGRKDYFFNKGESYFDVKFRALMFLYKNLNLEKDFSVIISHNILVKSILCAKGLILSGDCFVVGFKIHENLRDIEKLIKLYKPFYRKGDQISDINKINELNEIVNSINLILSKCVYLERSLRIPNLQENTSDESSKSDI